MDTFLPDIVSTVQLQEPLLHPLFERISNDLKNSLVIVWIKLVKILPMFIL